MIDAAFVQDTFDRLDLTHTTDLAAQAGREWDDQHGQPFELAYMPGDGTHYGLLFTVLRPGMKVLWSPGGGSMDTPGYTVTGCRFDGGCAIVTYLQRNQSMALGRREFVYPSRIHDLLGASPASALALAVLLNEITGPWPDWKENFIATCATCLPEGEE